MSCLILQISNAKASEERSPASFRGEPLQETSPHLNHHDPSLNSPDENFGLTGNWSGKRSTLSENGWDFALIYKGELNRVFDGGLQQKTVYLENLDLRATIDLEKSLGISSTTIFIYGLGNFGGDRKAKPSLSAGDAQVSSNIETPTDSFKLYNFWIQKEWSKGNSVLFGLHDLNSEFYATNLSALFFNSSFGIGTEMAQSGVNGPSIFPTAALALRLRFALTEETYLLVGAFNAQAGDPSRPHDTIIRASSSDGLLLVAEAGYSIEEKAKYGLGVWSYTKKVDSLDPSGSPEFSQGLYLLAEQLLIDHFGVFARAGFTNEDVLRFAASWSVGAVYTGLIPGRPKDCFGVAATTAINGSTYRRLNAATRSETSYEVNYRFEVANGFVLQPDFQYIQNPDTNSEVPDAKVGALRVEISF